MRKALSDPRMIAASQSAGTYLTADERAHNGRLLRDAVPRASQAGWKASADRENPIDLLVRSNEGRIPTLIPIRFERMSASPFAFFRGSAILMAADLARTPTSGIRVQACGDAHLMNFGGFATPERNIIFDINDLDETLPAPFEWDLKRLAASVVIAAQYLQLPRSDEARVSRDLVREYRERMMDYASMRALDVWYDRIDLQKYSDRCGNPQIVEAARKRLAERIEAERRRTVPDHFYPKLVSLEGARPRIKDEPPLIYHPDASVAPGLESGYVDAIASYRETLPEHTRILFDRFHFLDMAIKVVGVGSVGTMCGLGLFMAADHDPLFLQVKEARASVLEPYAGKSLHANHGQRVIAGQRIMQAASDVFLGWTRGKNGRDFYVRQLRDMKMTAVIEDWDTAMLRQYARMCAHALARAHARSGDAAMIAGYMGSGRTMDDAISEFATEYSSQNQHDYRTFVGAIRDGSIEVLSDG
ncbi:DUF2252 domain-containing protein [Paraburkholderia gardini]|uniref:DUF2252 domain-containing protein n=1 Tax=Paraburkholderia gardini TaxID=2823469 RepID=A0ABM8U185_9BURK|nr:DUF2252 domain-containing protein [Paraburkholderia gardini]CAG4893578.1 hypothetical protein R54767_01589 [Paraburkholderia gardini]CAG4908822.1 hypothetical protein R69919_03629 [Paraburkholderia gardini]